MERKKGEADQTITPRNYESGCYQNVEVSKYSI